MKIFYGVQGTGNGHITRARVMADALNRQGFAVQFLFSGRPEDKYFDMAVFGDYQCRTGLTFDTQKGKVNYLGTLLKSHPRKFLSDINALDLSGYDLVISDFEPVTSWAGRKQKQQVLGIGHQYAFSTNIPKKGSDPLADLVMKNFAPVSQGLGLHWHHFGQPILPPIIETPDVPKRVQANKIVVYLPFEDTAEVIEMFAPYRDFEFHIYAPNVVVSPHAHIQCNPLSRDGFQKDLYDSAGIISNAGFELASEALQLGKKILAKPLHAQMEQISNAEALKELSYGQTMYDFDRKLIEKWLNTPHAVRITYPDVAARIVDWISQGMPKLDQDFFDGIWNDVNVIQVEY
ncbi:MAG: glycosyltransferase family protein [Methylococcales bacterium]|nr:glycosyltransferase family protein [Methylococcales bacterium]